MNTTKHTPGPWIIASDDLSIEAPSHPSNGTPLIAQLYASSHFGYDERMANARLIAAAPELLETLKAVLSFMDTDSRNDQQFDPALKLDSSIAVEAAYEAIAKATNPTL